MDDQPTTFRVWYSCKRCGKERTMTEVLFRRPGEEITAYMRYVIKVVGRHHRHVSPRCSATVLDELIVPMPEDAPSDFGIGEYHEHYPKDPPGPEVKFSKV